MKIFSKECHFFFESFSKTNSPKNSTGSRRNERTKLETIILIRIEVMKEICSHIVGGKSGFEMLSGDCKKDKTNGIAYKKNINVNIVRYVAKIALWNHLREYFPEIFLKTRMAKNTTTNAGMESKKEVFRTSMIENRRETSMSAIWSNKCLNKYKKVIKRK